MQFLCTSGKYLLSTQSIFQLIIFWLLFVITKNTNVPLLDHWYGLRLLENGMSTKVASAKLQQLCNF